MQLFLEQHSQATVGGDAAGNRNITDSQFLRCSDCSVDQHTDCRLLKRSRNIRFVLFELLMGERFDMQCDGGLETAE